MTHQSTHQTSTTAGCRRIRRSTVRILSLAVGALATALSTLAVGASSASATTNVDYCWHARVSIIAETLPASNSAGIILDQLVYHYTATGWQYTGTYSRFYGTTGGAWNTTQGTQTNLSQFYLARGSGFYMLRNHIYWALNPSVGGWNYVYDYSDDLRGTQTYCQS